MLALLCKQMIPEEDRVIFLGDYIDRGPDSRGVVEQLAPAPRTAWPELGSYLRSSSPPSMKQAMRHALTIIHLAACAADVQSAASKAPVPISVLAKGNGQRLLGVTATTTIAVSGYLAGSRMLDKLLVQTLSINRSKSAHAFGAEKSTACLTAVWSP